MKTKSSSVSKKCLWGDFVPFSLILLNSPSLKSDAALTEGGRLRYSPGLTTEDSHGKITAAEEHTAFLHPS